MISSHLSPIALTVAIVFCTTVSNAQETNIQPAEKAQAEAKETEALRQKAFSLLESLSGQINTLQSAENRARLGANIADSLWSHNEERARALFARVESDIQLGLQIQKIEDRRDFQTLRVFLKLRADTVERIAKHDAESAMAFLKATLPSSNITLPSDEEQNLRSLEVRLAKRIAAHNPDLALKLGRQSLERGFSDQLLSLLRQLNKKHREQGRVLYQEIVLKLRSENLARSWPALYFAQNLASSFIPPEVDESAFRELIDLFITSALTHGCGNEMASGDQRATFCRQAASFWPRMEKVDPLRAAQLKHWAPQGDRSWSMRHAYIELEELFQDGTVDEILELAARYPQIEGHIYSRGMMKALASGDIARARKIAKEYSGQPDTREHLRRELDHFEKRFSLNKEKLSVIQERLSKLTLQQGVGALLYVASQIGEQDRGAAMQVINQAHGLVDTMKPGREQTEAQIGLALMYCLEKSDRGFAIMESVLPKLNDLVEGAAKLDGYDHYYLRDGEWNMSADNSVGRFLTTLAQNAGHFAWLDFDRAVSLAAQFERLEIRLMAQLKLAQGILAGPPKRVMQH